MKRSTVDKSGIWPAIVRAIGLDDGKGNLSFNKSITLAMCVMIIGAVYRSLVIETHATIIVVCVLFSGYGFKGIQMFSTMYRRTDTITTQVQVAIKEESEG
jgi:hypothetical protein